MIERNEIIAEQDKGIWKWIGLVFLFLWFISMLMGCSPAKQAQRKDDKAEARVLTRPNLFDKIGRYWEQFHPCVNDTITTTKTDTLSEPIFIEGDCPDSSTAKSPTTPVRPFDTTVAGVRVRVQNGKLLVTGRKEVITNTVTNTVEDTRRLDLCKQDLARATNERDVYLADKIRLEGELKNSEKAKVWAAWKQRLIFGIPLLLIILAFIFKKRIPIIKNI